MRHPYHLVEQSPWPILVSLNLLFLLISFVSYLNGYLYGYLNLKIAFTLVLTISLFWIYDIITESLYMGYHSFKVSKGLILGFIFFILTEIMLFFSLFWAYFHSALSPTDLIWPPVGIDLINPWSIPFLNTFLLLYSGVAATWAHHDYLSFNKDSKFILALGISIILGVIFIFLQGYEYYYSTFDISDSVYSSSFYLLTGTHGVHTIIGVLLLVFVFIRLYMNNNPLTYFDLALIYYHLIDVVWLVLFTTIYYMSY